MKRLFLLFGIFAGVFLVIPIPSLFAHIYEFEDEIENDLLFQCEVHYGEFPEIDLLKWLERHNHVPLIKYCVELYKHPIWTTEHPARNKVLNSILEQTLPELPEVKQRHLPATPATIPLWVKNDAKIWANGEHTDSRFAYSIRYMINSNILTTPTFPSTSTVGCDENKICARPGDFVLYYLTHSSQDDVKNIRHKFGNIIDNDIQVTSQITSKQGRFEENFLVNLETGITNKKKDGKCCTIYSYFYPVPLDLKSKINSSKFTLELVAETNMSYKNNNRSVFFAKDETGNYTEVIDKKIGLVLSSKYEIIDIIKKWEKTELVDTNIYERKADIQFKELNIPNWWKNNVSWWLEGQISDKEYLTALEYLWEKNILRI